MKSAWGKESEVSRKVSWARKQAWSAVSELTKLELLAVGLSGYRYEEAVRLPLRIVLRIKMLQDLKVMFEG